MRKKSVKTTAKSTEAITETAAKVKETVKAAAKKVEESAPAEKTAEVVKEVVNKAPEAVQKAEKTATKAVRKAAGARVKEVSLEIFETNVSLKDVEKAVKKDVAEKGLTGDICIYINAERRAAYYTVNQEGSDEYKVDLGNL